MVFLNSMTFHDQGAPCVPQRFLATAEGTVYVYHDTVNLSFPLAAIHCISFIQQPTLQINHFLSVSFCPPRLGFTLCASLAACGTAHSVLVV